MKENVMTKYLSTFIFFNFLASGFIDTKVSHMKIVIGSTNPVKIAAFAELIPSYKILESAELISKNVPSLISEQPLSLEETIQGAKNRAQAAAAYGDIGIGIESGLFNIPNTNRHMDICVCCIYANNTFMLGFSSAFEIPTKVLGYILNEHVDLGQAMKLAGLTDQEQIGAGQGAIGILTNGRITRKEYTKQAIIMALIQLEYAAIF